MNDTIHLQPPLILDTIWKSTRDSGFPMASDDKTGSLLRTLAATKPNGAILELGTGTGLSAAWIIAGMHAKASLISVDNDAGFSAIAQTHLGSDPRVTFYVEDGGLFLEHLRGQTFDMIFADTWSGKYTHLEEALDLLAIGAIYVIDDMLPQPNWPEGHASKVSALITQLESRADLAVTKLAWATGIIICTKTAV